MSGLRVVTFNVWVGQAPSQLRRNLIELANDTGRPHVIALQEAKRFGGTIPGYCRIDSETFRREAKSNVLLVRNADVTVHRYHEVAVQGPMWKGPKHGLEHPPRIFPGTTVEVDDQRWDVLDVHRTPGGPTSSVKSNRRASWAAEDRDLESWLDSRWERHPERPALVVGDHNNRVFDRNKLSISDLARRTECNLAVLGIDGALFRNCTVKARKLDRLYGSDGHRPVVIDARTK